MRLTRKIAAILMIGHVFACTKNGQPPLQNGKAMNPVAFQISQSTLPAYGSDLALYDVLARNEYLHGATWEYDDTDGQHVIATSKLTGNYDCAIDYPVGTSVGETTNTSPCVLEGRLVIFFTVKEKKFGYSGAIAGGRFTFADGRTYTFKSNFDVEDNDPMKSRLATDLLRDLVKGKFPNSISLVTQDASGNNRGVFLSKPK